MEQKEEEILWQLYLASLTNHDGIVEKIFDSEKEVIKKLVENKSIEKRSETNPPEYVKKGRYYLYPDTLHILKENNEVQRSIDKTASEEYRRIKEKIEDDPEFQFLFAFDIIETKKYGRWIGIGLNANRYFKKLEDEGKVEEYCNILKENGHFFDDWLYSRKKGLTERERIYPALQKLKLFAAYPSEEAVIAELGENELTMSEIENKLKKLGNFASSSDYKDIWWELLAVERKIDELLMSKFKISKKFVEESKFYFTKKIDLLEKVPSKNEDLMNEDARLDFEDLIKQLRTLIDDRNDLAHGRLKLTKEKLGKIRESIKNAERIFDKLQKSI